jgi:hypothetical protein
MDKSLNNRWVKDIRGLSTRLGSYLFDHPCDPSRVRLIDGPVNGAKVFEGAVLHNHFQGVEDDDEFLQYILDIKTHFLWGMLYAAAIRRCRDINERLRALNPDTPEHRDAFDQLNIAITNLEYIEESASSFIKPAADTTDSRLPAQR